MAEHVLVLRRIRKRFGNAVPADDVSLEVAAGEFFTLLGPSGSGKSTILRIIAGLERADDGEILLDGRDVGDTPPWRRHLGMVFQQYANFPHMNVAENVAYGLRRRGRSRAEKARRVDELLRLVGLEGFGRRSVATLSGGEQQRVAIARALAPRPAMLLLDEPLAALDEKIRREMQAELRSIQKTTGTTFIYVTHDQEEALTMSDRIAVLNRGRAVQCGAPEQVFRFPRTRFAAEFFRGCNLLEARLEAGGEAPLLLIAGQRLRLDGRAAGRIGPQPIALRAEALLLGAEAQAGDLILPARLEAITYRGLYTECRLRLADDQALSAALTRRHDFTAGAAIEIGIRAEDVVLLEED